MNGFGFFPVDDGEVDDAGKSAAQGFQQHPFGTDFSQLRIQSAFQRYPDPLPDLRRLATDDRLAEALSQVNVGVDKSGHDCLPGQGAYHQIRELTPKTIGIRDGLDFTVFNQHHSVLSRPLRRKQHLGGDRITVAAKQF